MYQSLIRVLSTSIFLISSLYMSGQAIMLSPDAGLVVSPSTCMTITAGETLQFERSGSCGANAYVSNDMGTTSLLTTADMSFGFTFDTPGEYVIFCNSSPTSTATPAVCIIVTDVVPTVGEWGVITLGLLLMITMVIGYRTQTEKTTELA